jgi:putative transposase
MTAELISRLGTLGMHATAEGLDDITATAIKKRWSPHQLFEHVADLEEKERARRSLERRMRLSKLGRFKLAADFDWDWPSQINADAVHAALGLDFLRDGKNVVLVGAQGLGKTMLAKNIVHNAILGGYSAVFLTAAELVLDLASQESARALDRRMKHYARVACLCIDEIGYLEYEQRAADLLFQLVSKRYENKPLVLTTNKSFSDWTSIFPGAACATALVDRVVLRPPILLDSPLTTDQENDNGKINIQWTTPKGSTQDGAQEDGGGSSRPSRRIRGRGEPRRKGRRVPAQSMEGSVPAIGRSGSQESQAGPGRAGGAYAPRENRGVDDGQERPARGHQVARPRPFSPDEVEEVVEQVSASSGTRPVLYRTCALLRCPRSSLYKAREDRNEPPKERRRPGPVPQYPDEELAELIRIVLDESPFVGEGHRKAWARLRLKKIPCTKPRVLRVMREHGLLAPQRGGVPHGKKAHDGTIVTERPDEMWGTDMSRVLLEDGTNAAVFVAVEHYTAELMGSWAAARGDRFEALEPIRQAIEHAFGACGPNAAQGVLLRHDHGSCYMAQHFQDEIKHLGLRSSPAFVREPEGNGCAERIIRTLKEQLLWTRSFKDLDDLNRALQDFRKTYNELWLIGRLGHRTPAQARAESLSFAEAA